MGLSPYTKYSELLNMTGIKDDAFTGNNVSFRGGLCCLALDHPQAFGGNQVNITMGILFWICAGVVSAAMMQTIFMLLLKSTKSDK